MKVRNKRIDLRREAWLEVEDLAAPEETLLKDSELEACDDAEIVAAAFESLEEVRVSRGVCVGDAAVGQNYFVADDVAKPRA